MGTPTGDWTLGVCLHWGNNLQPISLWENIPTTWATLSRASVLKLLSQSANHLLASFPSRSSQDLTSHHTSHPKWMPLTLTLLVLLHMVCKHANLDRPIICFSAFRWGFRALPGKIPIYSRCAPLCMCGLLIQLGPQGCSESSLVSMATSRTWSPHSYLIFPAPIKPPIFPALWTTLSR